MLPWAETCVGAALCGDFAIHTGPNYSRGFGVYDSIMYTVVVEGLDMGTSLSISPQVFLLMTLESEPCGSPASCSQENNAAARCLPF